jgi:hypothetical protein
MNMTQIAIGRILQKLILSFFLQWLKPRRKVKLMVILFETSDILFEVEKVDI